MILCSCGEPAEICWTVEGTANIRQRHELCSNCMSGLWAEISLKFSGSQAKECSTFKVINQ